MPRKNQVFLLLICSVTLFLSVYFFYVQPKWLADFFSDKPQLYGHLTRFSLTPYPMKNQFEELVTWKNYSDKPLYVTTGFTSCRNSCPVTMAHYQNLAEQLNKKAYFSFITVDPKRDSSLKLKAYLSAINHHLIGIRVSNNKILAQVLKEFKQQILVSNNKKTITHNNYIYLVHPKMKGFIIYDTTVTNISQMVEDFERLSLI